MMTDLLCSEPSNRIAFRYFSDMHGAFAVYTDPESHGNKVLRQQADHIPPLCTHGRGATAYAAVLGDASMRVGYSVITQVHFKRES